MKVCINFVLLCVDHFYYVIQFNLYNELIGLTHTTNLVGLLSNPA